MNREHVTPPEISEGNSKKLDRIMFLIGDEHSGLIQTVTELREAMFGIQGRNGITQKVDTMWRIYIWLLCAMSAGFGFLVKTAFDMFVRKP